MTHFPVSRQRVKKGIVVTTVTMVVMLLLSACGGNTETQQKANSGKVQLDRMLAHAQSIGVPRTLLQPILQQEAQISSTNAPLTLLNDQPATDYYSNVAQRYQILGVQVHGLEYQITQQYDYQAALDLQDFEKVLAQRQAQNFTEAKTFAHQLTQDQNLLAKAQTPNDYLRISTAAKESTRALHLMGSAYNSLVSLQLLDKQLRASHIDTNALDQQYQQDLQLFRIANKPDDFTQLMDQTRVQIQAASDFSTQAIPYVGAAKLQQFSANIQQLKAYGQDTTAFQQRLHSDQLSLNNAQSISDYLKVSSQIDHDMASLQFALTQGYATSLLKQFHQEVTHWGNTHQYHDAYDGNSYNLDYEYDMQGIGQDADSAVQYAQSTQAPADYQAAIDLLKNDFLNLRAMEADYSDKTPSNSPHNTDIQLMKHYNAYGSNSGQVLVVSLIEQTLRYYDNGKLVRSFSIVSGQYLKPSPPGFWSIILRESPTVFKSSEPQGSAFWYPDTQIKYALEYHAGGYFFHDSWWRADYGPGRNFPHADSSGTTSFNDNGSHGCLNMNPNDVAWLYPQIAWGAAVIVY